MAIISASRRTDIPALYGDWFMKRLAEKSFVVRNPYNPKQISHITFKKEDIDCIVMWTKNPIPFFKHLDKLSEYPFYFQFTITPYGKQIEPCLPDKDTLADAFVELSQRTNKRVIWRYDPIVFNKDFTPDWHKEAFAYYAQKLKGSTDRCVISFVDTYDNNRYSLSQIGEHKLDVQKLEEFCLELSQIGKENGMQLCTCAEVIDYEKAGVKRGRCIDPDYIESICGYPLKSNKDAAQREACGCMESIEIGAYNTCTNGCRYCYATKNKNLIPSIVKKYDINSPALCDTIYEFEHMTERKLRSLRDYKREENEMQISMF